ncbi:MAG: DNA-directed RNA polymerase subunit N [Candidatus Aenigmarchaeota archaeon]|nr:DNA-directed RNA polymerase subunit N [Candidatus Aenigmarchaeota archaeon]
MMIPIRCITCGKPVGHLWEKYSERVKNGEKIVKVLDDLGLERYCCRAMFMSHVDMIKDVARFKR